MTIKTCEEYVLNRLDYLENKVATYENDIKIKNAHINELEEFVCAVVDNLEDGEVNQNHKFFSLMINNLYDKKLYDCLEHMVTEYKKVIVDEEK